MHARTLALTALPPLLFSLSAQAQTPPDATKVDKAKPQETAAALPAGTTGSPFSQESQATVGFLFNDGNTSAAAGRVGGYYQLRFDVHAVRLDVAAGLTSVAQDPDADPANGFGLPLFAAGNDAATSAAARLRYDFFLTVDDSLYASGFVFHDSAANLLVRLRADVGYRHFFFNAPKHSLAGEVGAVYTIDDAPVGDTNGDTVVDLNDKSQFEATGTIGARLAIAYTNALSDAVSYTTTLEVIPNIFPDVDAPFESARTSGGGDNKLGFGEATTAAWNNTLTVNVNQSVGIGLNVTVLYDNGAIARRNAYTNHDISAAFQLTYKLF